MPPPAWPTAAPPRCSKRRLGLQQPDVSTELGPARPRCPPPERARTRVGVEGQALEREQRVVGLHHDVGRLRLVGKHAATVQSGGAAREADVARRGARRAGVMDTCPCAARTHPPTARLCHPPARRPPACTPAQLREPPAKRSLPIPSPAESRPGPRHGPSEHTTAGRHTCTSGPASWGTGRSAPPTARSPCRCRCRPRWSGRA